MALTRFWTQTLAKLPLSFLYRLSDVLYVFLYYVIGYRKSVVRTNLQRSFKEKSKAELRKIEKAYYRYLTDLMVETLKVLEITPEEIKRRCEFTPESQAMLARLYAERKSFIVVMGHFGNWEWAGAAFSFFASQPLNVIYHPLASSRFDDLMVRIRTRFGNRLYPMKDAPREMMKRRNEVNATAFIADQTPAPENAYWTTFLDQETPIFWGTETLAQRLNFPVIYASVRRLRRGYYSVEGEILVADPSSLAKGEISELHVRRLEQDIRRQPETWLWSHRRWKHKRGPVS